MHRKLLNEARIELEIIPDGPILVKSGVESADPTRPDMEFVRIHHSALGRETVYLPGSSLKGVIRSYCEKITRTLGLDACDPTKDSSCGRRLEKKTNSATLYKESCWLCKLFGSTKIASRIRFNDAYPIKVNDDGEIDEGFAEATNRTEERTGVAIDRVLGSVAVGPFNMEVVTNGGFATEIWIRNFETWQLGLLGLAFRDLGEGRVPIGFGKSRGFGQVKAEISKVAVRYIKPFEEKANQDGKTAVYGIGKLISTEEQDEYGLKLKGDDVAWADTVVQPSSSETGIGSVYLFSGEDQTRALFRACVKCWAKVVNEND